MAAAAPTPTPQPRDCRAAQSNAPATTATMPLMGTAKSMMGPPDPAAAKLIEPEPAKTRQGPAKTAAATPSTRAAEPRQRRLRRPRSRTGSAEIAAATPATKRLPPTSRPSISPPPRRQRRDGRAGSPQLAVQRTEFGVDVGGANSVGGLRALWRGLLKSRSNAPLAALQPIIVIKESNNGLGMQLRLVAGPLSDAAAAAKICAALIENERPCETTGFDGQRLAMKADDTPASTGSHFAETRNARRRRRRPKSPPPQAGDPGRQTWRGTAIKSAPRSRSRRPKSRKPRQRGQHDFVVLPPLELANNSDNPVSCGRSLI